RLEGRDSRHELDHGGEGHEHDDFDSFVLGLPPSLGRAELLALVETVMREHDVLRLKGFAAIPGTRARLAIQAVCARVSASTDRPWAGNEARETRAVVIGQSRLAREAVTRGLQRAARAA